MAIVFSYDENHSMVIFRQDHAFDLSKPASGNPYLNREVLNDAVSYVYALMVLKSGVSP